MYVHVPVLVYVHTIYAQARVNTYLPMQNQARVPRQNCETLTTCLTGAYCFLDDPFALHSMLDSFAVPF